MSKSRSVGTKLKITTGSAGSTSLTPVGSLKSISGIDASADTVDVTDMGNESGYREFLGGFKDAGEVTVSGFFDGEDAGQTAMHDAFESGETKAFVIAFPAAIGKQWSFSGIVTKFTTAADVDDAITFDATIKVSGAASLEALS